MTTAPPLPPALAGEAARHDECPWRDKTWLGDGMVHLTQLREVNGRELTFSRSDLGGLSAIIRIPYSEVSNRLPRPRTARVIDLHQVRPSCLVLSGQRVIAFQL